MSRRGMTIVELLLALALLSSLTIACVSWTTAAARTLADQGGEAVWARGAEASLQWVHDLLVIEDPIAGRDWDSWRVRVEPERLTTRTRQVVAITGEPPRLAETVELAADAGALSATFYDAERRRLHRRPLLAGETRLQVSLTELDRSERELSVTLVSESGTTVTREWRLPAEAVQ